MDVTSGRGVTVAVVEFAVDQSFIIRGGGDGERVH